QSRKITRHPAAWTRAAYADHALTWRSAFETLCQRLCASCQQSHVNANRRKRAPQLNITMSQVFIYRKYARRFAACEDTAYCVFNGSLYILVARIAGVTHIGR